MSKALLQELVHQVVTWLETRYSHRPLLLVGIHLIEGALNVGIDELLEHVQRSEKAQSLLK